MESYYNKDYNLNPKIIELLRKKKPINIGLNYLDAENIYNNVLLGKNISKIEFVDYDKIKILSYFNKFNPNKYNEEIINNVYNFIILNFENEEIIEYIKTIINNNYHPGVVINLLRVDNNNIIYFMSLFKDYIDLYDGAIINTKFIGDVKNIYPNVNYDEKHGSIIETDVKEKILELLKLKFEDKLDIIVKDDIYILYTKSKDIIEKLKSMNINIQLIPIYYFNE